MKQKDILKRCLCQLRKDAAFRKGADLSTETRQKSVTVDGVTDLNVGLGNRREAKIILIPNNLRNVRRALAQSRVPRR